MIPACALMEMHDPDAVGEATYALPLEQHARSKGTC